MGVIEEGGSTADNVFFELQNNDDFLKKFPNKKNLRGHWDGGFWGSFPSVNTSEIWITRDFCGFLFRLN